MTYNKLKNKKILILGATGFIGSILQTKLRELGANVTSMGRRNSDIFLDLGQTGKIPLDINTFDACVFLSGVSSPEYCSKNQEYSKLINVTNTIKVISFLIKQNIPVLFASSDVVYGHREEPVYENTTLNPTCSYAKMKAAVEQSFIGHPEFYVMRLSYVWAIGDKFTKFLLKSSANNEKIKIFHPFVRSIISIEDVLQFIITFSISPQKIPHVVNLSGNKQLAKADIAKVFQEHIGLDYELEPPNDDFFKFRPSVINMKSLHLDQILERPPIDVETFIMQNLKDQRTRNV